MLTTARAIVLAAFVVGGATLAHAVVPRYQITTVLADGGGVSLLRVDRWRGTAEIAFSRGDVRPAWFTVATR